MKKIEWYKMSKDERIERMRQIAVKEASEDGVFYPSNCYRLYKAMEVFNVTVDEVLKGSGLVKSNKCRISWNDMSQEQRIETIAEIAKEQAVDGVVGKSKLEMRDVLKRYKIDLDKIIQELGLVSVRDKSRVFTKKAKKSFIIPSQALEYIVINNNIVDTKTLAEFVSTLTLNKDTSVKQKVFKEIGFTESNVENGLAKISAMLMYTEEYLSALTLDRLNEILLSLQNGIKKSTNDAVDRKIKNFFSYKAAEAGLFVPAAIEFNQGIYRQDFVNHERRKIKNSRTVYEHSILIFPENMPYAADVLLALKEYASIEPLLFAFHRLHEYKKGVYSKATRSAFNRAVIDYILMPLQESGLEFAEPLKKRHNRVGVLTKKYIEHLEGKDGLEKKDRTFGWYLFEIAGIMDVHQSTKASVYDTYCDYLDTKVKELTFSDIEKMKTKPKAYKLNSVLQSIVEDGVCSFMLTNSGDVEMIEDFDFSAAVWIYGKNSKISFDEIDEEYEIAVRYYIKSLIKKGGCVRKSQIFKMLEVFKGANILTLNDFNRNDEMKFYLTLVSMIKDEASRGDARSTMKEFRSFVARLKKLKLGIFPNSFVLNYDFNIKIPPPEIVTYTDEEMEAIVRFLQSDEAETNKYISRLEFCAFGIQALTARRIGEIVSENAGLTVDALYEWGNSGELMMKYFSAKHNKHEAVLLSDLVGNREDPFANVLVELVLKLFDEALDITSEYRHILPDSLKKYLFVVRENKVDKGLYKKLSAGFVSSAVKKIYRSLDIDISKASHIFRHTMATGLILSGGTVMDAADALQDQPSTVSKHYHQFVSCADTLKHFAEKNRSVMVDSLGDSEHFLSLENNEHNVLRPDEMSPEGNRMVGGSCIDSVDRMLECKSYQMIRSAKGCPGCRHLEVNAEENKSFWQKEVKATFVAMEEVSMGSIAYEWEESKNRRARGILDSIVQKELENEFA